MLFNPKEEGLTHINIYSKAQSSLGRSLSNFERCDIVTSIGKFQSIEGLIYFLGSFDNRLRTVSGLNAKSIGKVLDRKIRLPDDVFKQLVIEAMMVKADKYRISIKQSTLPFTHYYCYGNKIVDIPKWDWQVKEWETIRDKIKKGQL